MSTQLADETQSLNNPLEVIEAVASQSDMNAERMDDTELHVNVGGLWRDIAVWFAWREDMRVLQLGAPLELKVPDEKMVEICKLLARIFASATSRTLRVWKACRTCWSTSPPGARSTERL